MCLLGSLVASQTFTQSYVLLWSERICSTGQWCRPRRSGRDISVIRSAMGVSSVLTRYGQTYKPESLHSVLVHHRHFVNIAYRRIPAASYSAMLVEGLQDLPRLIPIPQSVLSSPYRLGAASYLYFWLCVILYATNSDSSVSGRRMLRASSGGGNTLPTIGLICKHQWRPDAKAKSVQRSFIDVPVPRV